MEFIEEILNYELFTVPVWAYGAALASLAGGFVLKALSAALFTRLHRVAKKTRISMDEIVLSAVDRPVAWACVVAGLWVMFLFLFQGSEPSDVKKILTLALKGMSIYLLVWVAMRLSDGLCGWWARVAEKTDTRLDDQIVPIVRRSSKLFLVLIGGMLVIQNMGYSVGSLLAGLGLGGAALALASKDTVANVFGSLVIFLDQPFQVGDWIQMGSVEGTVEEVGLRTTRVRTFANSLITVPNSLFTTNSVNNWSRMEKRRLKMTIGVTYGSSPEQIHAAVEAIKALIAQDERFCQDFSLVTFESFGPSSLDIFIYCFTKTTVWSEYLAVKQDFLFAVMRAVRELGLDFAFPSQSVYLESVPKELQGGGPRDLPLS